MNDDFINSVNKLKKSDIDVEAGVIENTIVVFNRYGRKCIIDDYVFDMQVPAIISIEWYKKASLKRNLEIPLQLSQELQEWLQPHQFVK